MSGLAGNKVQLVGFGQDVPGGYGWPVKREAKVTLGACPSGLCYSYSAVTPVSCNGDSGGPMFVNDVNTLIGVASHIGVDCATSDDAIYSDITRDEHKAWLAAMATPPPVISSLSKFTVERLRAM